MKKFILLPALLACAACADGPTDSLAKAKSEFAAHNYAAARIHLASYIAAHPGDRDVLLLQARTLLALGDGDGAQAVLAQLTGGTPKAGLLAELSAEAALLRGSPDAALQFLGTSTGPEAERLRAMIALQKGDRALAQNHFEASIAAGGNARAFADYARYHLLGGAIAEAETLAAKAAKADPDGIDTLLIQAELSVRRGDLSQALETYKRASKLYPNSLAALIGQAAVLGDLGRFDQMQSLLDRISAIAPNDPATLFLRARAAAAHKDWAGVRSVVQPIESSLGATDPLRVIYGEALLRLGQPEQAIAQLQPALRAMPGNPDAARPFAEAMMARGDPRGALAVIRPFADSPAARREDLEIAAKAATASGDPAAAGYQARSKQPAVVAAGRDLIDGDAAMRAGNWAGAAQAYDRILKSTDGRNPVVLNNMAYAQLMLGNGPLARTYADRALKEAPNHPSVLDTAGWVRFKTGQDKAEARNLLRRAAELAPGNSTIRAHLAEVERASN